LPDISVKTLLEAGVHFGHQTSRWNPKMAPFLFGARSGVHIIDLEQTLAYLQDAQAKVEELTKAGGLVLFVGTKRQGKEIVLRAAERAHMPSVTERWLGGLLTNFETIKNRLELLQKLRTEKKAGDWERLPKKEVAKKTQMLERLETSLGGVAGLKKPPVAVFVVDVVREDLAVREAKKLGLPVVGVVDSNADPDGIEYPIPGNDDAVGAIKVVAEAIAESALKGYELYQTQSAKEAKQAEATAAKEKAKKEKEAKAAKVAEGKAAAEPAKS
jgi:small subunit ribosomal protein S2